MFSRKELDIEWVAPEFHSMAHKAFTPFGMLLLNVTTTAPQRRLR